jgi:biotin carboxyl carrier protein
MQHTLDLVLAESESGIVLRSPEVGHFTAALPRGAVVAPGESAGILTRLGMSFELRVPHSAYGTVVSDPPDLVRQPVGYGDVLYRLASSATSAPTAPTKSSERAADTTQGLVLHAPQSGRFYHRPAPGEPAFVTAGSIVKDGQPVGMIEVMKTFSHVTWRSTPGQPASVRVVALAAADGADVKVGDVLLKLEPVQAER